jgi:ligand-binding sensor domain-containing protein
MKTIKLIIMTIYTLIIIGILTIFSSCNEQGQKSSNKDAENTTKRLIGDTVSIIDGEIRGIIQDSKNNLWFASNGNGVFKYDGTTIINYKEKHGLSSDYTWMVKEGKDGKIWFKTNVRPKDIDAICYFDGYEFKTIQPDTNLITYDFKKGELLFDYYFFGKSLSKIKIPHTSPIKNEENKRHHYDIFTTYIDKSGNVWFGTCTAGICKYDGEKYTWFDNKELGSATRDIYEDRNGTLWAGNNGDGLFRYDGKDFINFSREKNLHNPDFEKYPIGKPGLMSRIWKITEDSQGNLWVATIDNGVWMINGQEVTNYTTENGLSMDNIWTVYSDKNGKLWIGTEGDGVYTFDGDKFNKFKL